MGQGGFNGNGFRREGMAHAEVGRKEEHVSCLATKRLAKLLNCHVEGGSDMT